ncbi:MAG: ankyrin repeat domain-containing protein [Kiritimatiellae bacterium]|nr:ankyrin repeat domain-containing protein [Kiritimatiellia bacterium]
MTDGRTALHLAAMQGQLNTVAMLVQKGADVRARTNAGQTALTLARQRKHGQVVDYLRKQGCPE